jgi:hypothetical protein
MLRCLKGSASGGACYSSNGDHGELTAFYQQRSIACTGKAAACCDANWGPQDASNPTEATKHECMTIDKCRLLQGMLVV